MPADPDNVVIHEGKLSQLKRFKDDVREFGVVWNAAWPKTWTCGKKTQLNATGWSRFNVASPNLTRVRTPTFLAMAGFDPPSTLPSFIEGRRGCPAQGRG